MQFHSMNQTEKGQLARTLVVLLAGGLLFSGCGAKGEVEASPTVTVQVDAAEKGPIQRKVVTDAVLYPRDQAAIVPEGRFVGQEMVCGQGQPREGRAVAGGA